MSLLKYIGMASWKEAIAYPSRVSWLWSKYAPERMHLQGLVYSRIFQTCSPSLIERLICGCSAEEISFVHILYLTSNMMLTCCSQRLWHPSQKASDCATTHNRTCPQHTCKCAHLRPLRAGGRAFFALRFSWIFLDLRI